MESRRAEYASRVGTEASLATNKVKAFQRVFQADTGTPVFYRTKFDRRFYRGVMVLSAVGIVLTMGSVYAMATNRLKRVNRK